MKDIYTKKHKWSHNTKSRAKDSSASQCLKCGYTRQYVGGIATYFRDDTVIDRYAPECDNRELHFLRQELSDRYSFDIDQLNCVEDFADAAFYVCNGNYGAADNIQKHITALFERALKVL